MNKISCTCAAICLVLPALVSAKPALPNAIPQHAAMTAMERDRVEGLIKLDVLVEDSTGTPVSGLERSDFSLLEEGRPQKILSFQAFNGRGAGAEPPVKIIFLIDTDEVPANLARDERNAVETYLRKDGGHLARPVSVFVLSDTGLWTVSHPSGDGNVLAREIEHNELAQASRMVGGRRALMPLERKDSPSESALSALADIAAEERTRPGRKLLLWIGPGWGIGTGAYADAKSGST